MNESVLKNYFDNQISTDILYSDIESSEVKTSHDVIEININQLQGEGTYEINTKHLLKLCDDAIAGNLKITHLTTIAFTLIFSEYFIWDDNIIATTIYDWDNPEINFPITIENLKKWKIYLETGEYTLC